MRTAHFMGRGDAFPDQPSTLDPSCQVAPDDDGNARLLRHFRRDDPASQEGNRSI